MTSTALNTKESNVGWLLRLHPLVLILIAVVIISSCRIIINEFIFDESLISSVLPADMTPSEIAQIMKMKNEYSWISYVLTPVNFIFIELLMAVTLYAAFSFLKTTISFKIILNAFLIAGVVAASIGLVNLLIQTQITPQVSSVEDIKNLDQLSLYSLFPGNAFDDWFNFILREINLKLVIYLLIAPYLITKFTSFNEDYVLNVFVSVSGGIWFIYTASVIGVLVSLQF